MPYSDPDKQRKAARESARRKRAEARAVKELLGRKRLDSKLVEPLSRDASPADQARALSKWSREFLSVPPGHPLAGSPMTLPDFAISFLEGALEARESLLCIARKNAKSAIVAVYLLGRLVGPLRYAGYRAGVCSVSKEKAAELKTQMLEIATASDLEGLTFRRSPAPGHVLSETGRVDILSADKSAGHAAGFDDAICDELGLFDEKYRGLVNGMRSSTSARDGRFLALSIQGDAPFTREILKRAGESSVHVAHFAAPSDCRLDDESAWLAANPGLGTIKSMAYMRDEARRAELVPSDQAAFRAFDLNQPQSATREMVCSLDSYLRCAAEPRHSRSGACHVGIDLGGSSSMCAAGVYWPDTRRLECFGGFGDDPGLVERGEIDGVGRRYVSMSDRGELKTFPGRVTPVSEFLKWVFGMIEGHEIERVLSDRYRESEARDALDAARLGHVPQEYRAQGSGRDGSEDVRKFQGAIEGGELRPGESLLLESAISESRIRYDPNGNPSLDKARSKGRIDALSASILAVGAGERSRTNRREATFFHVEL